MTTSFALRTVGELVAERPSRARVFEEYGIDYCCGGKRPLDEACATKQLAVDEVAAALAKSDREQADRGQPDWTTAPLTDLIENIVETHHGYLRRELPRLDALNSKVLAAHGAKDQNIGLCLGVFRDLCAEMRSHMMKEEEILFPAIRQLEAGTAGHFCFDTIASPIEVMEAEHDSAGDALARMRALTVGFTPPEDACNTYRVWLDGLATLERDMHTHVHKENNILFPRALALEASMAAS
jgi:regulator of cell morphogenesis and NO signaling